MTEPARPGYTQYDWWRENDRLATLARLWADPDYTASAIGAVLGCSKNAVIGQVHRTGLPSRRDSTPRVVVRPALADLAVSQCRWPSGDPKQPNFRFCSARAVESKPYCAAHEKKAHQIRPPKDPV